MLAGGGQLDGVRILSSKTLAYITENHLPEYAADVDMPDCVLESLGL